MSEALKAQIIAVAAARNLAHSHLQSRAEATAKFAADNALLITLTANAVKNLEQEETTLRQMTLAAYAQTGNKTPSPGVSVRETVQLLYEERDALGWAKEHNLALQLDRKAFEKIAKADTLDCVKYLTVPQATIATDLTPYLEKKEEVKGQKNSELSMWARSTV